jgi:hypothetical protein
MGIAADLAIILVAALIEFTWFMLPAARAPGARWACWTITQNWRCSRRWQP